MWHSLSRLVFILILLIGAIPIVYSFLPEVSARKLQMARVDELKSDIERRRMVLARHQREENLLKHDPEYVGLIARDRLDLMKEGETIYRFAAPGKTQPLPRH